VGGGIEEDALMSGVCIVSDSGCDLEQDEADLLNIEIVPLSIRFGSEEFTDRRDLSVEDFYKNGELGRSPPDGLPIARCLRTGVPQRG
jgi:fatty acid-binding protein DegV